MDRRSLTRYDIATLTVLIVISLLIYSRAFDNDFRQDDAAYLRHAETTSLLDSFRPSAGFAFYRPGSLLLFRLEYLLFGRGSGSYIAANFVFHCLTALLAFLVLGKIGSVPGSESTAAGLFLLGLFHYGKTVMWACCCGPIASVALSLAGVLVAMRRRRRDLVLAAAIMSAAIFFHEAAIVTPAVAFLAVLACTGDGRLRWRSDALILLIPIPLFLAGYVFLAAAYPVYRHDTLPFAKAPAYLVRYAGFAVIPLQKTGIVDLPPVLRRLTGIAPQLHMAAGVMVLGVLGYLVAAGRRGLRILAVWAPAALVPYTLIVLPEDWLQLRYLYYAAIPLCGLAAAGWHRLAFSGKAGLRTAAILLIVLAVLCTSALVILLERHYAAFPAV